MNKSSCLMVALLLTSPAAFAVDASTVLGGALGGGVGAAIGEQVGGKDGAILGAAIGGATGAAMGSNSQTQVVTQPVQRVQPARAEDDGEEEPRHDHGRHNGERNHRHESED